MLNLEIRCKFYNLILKAIVNQMSNPKFSILFAVVILCLSSRIAFTSQFTLTNQNAQILKDSQPKQQIFEELPDTEAQDPLQRLIEQEIQLRQSFKMSYENYHGYPFGLPAEKSVQFYLEFPQDENIKGQVFVYWVDKDNTVYPPKFSEGQRVEVSVIKAKTGQLVLRQIFLITTGFAFTAIKGQRYVLAFRNDKDNQVPKMLELAISYLHPTGQQYHGINETLLQVERNTSAIHLQMLSRIKHTEQSMVLQEQMRVKLSNTSSSFLKYALWEIVTVVGLMIGQLFILKKIIQKNSKSIV